MKKVLKKLVTVILIVAALVSVSKAVSPVEAHAAQPTMYQKAVQANSKTGWCIVIKKSTHQSAIYKKVGGRWKQFSSYRVTIGAEKTPSRAGTFTIGRKYLWKDFAGSTGFYCSSLAGGASGYIHSILYKKGSRDVRKAKVVDSRLGVNASKGCIRYSAAAANWIYKNIPKGTKVVIMW